MSKLINFVIIDDEIHVKVHKAFVINKYKENLKKLSKDVVVPGFRKGKAPLHIVDKFLEKDLVNYKSCFETMSEIYLILSQDEIDVNNYMHYPDTEGLVEQFKSEEKFLSIKFIHS